MAERVLVRDVETPTAKYVIRRAVGTMHIMDSDEAVVARAKKCFRSDLKFSPAAERALRRIALAAHRENAKTYGLVMGGVR